MKTSYAAAGVLTIVLVLWMASGAFSSEPDDSAETTQSEEQNTTAAIKVEYIDVTLTPKSRDVVLQGQLEPRRHLRLRAETSSIVGTIRANKGQLVNKGDAIVSLEVQGRESNLREAQAQLKSALSQQRAVASLQQKGLTSQTEVEETQYQLASARAQIDRIERDINYTQVVAPFNGIINAVPVEVGEMVDRGEFIAELVDNSGFLVTAQVAQQTLAQLELGKAIEVKLITGETLPGTLTFISSLADSASRSFTVEAEVENADGKFAAGVSASLIVPIEQVEAVFITPSALFLGDNGDLGVKTIDENNMVTFTPITLVSSTLEGAWVTGIPDKSRVITLGQGFVKNGQEVDPVKSIETSKEAS